jgi:hypothetical protein
MALLLNHGRDAALPFENGVMGPMDFRVIEAFTPRMLRHRANVGSSDSAFAKLFDAHEDKHALLEYQGKKFLGQATNNDFYPLPHYIKASSACRLCAVKSFRWSAFDRFFDRPLRAQRSVSWAWPPHSHAAYTEQHKIQIVL